MTFQVSPLAASHFESLYGQSDEALAGLGARATIADAKPGYPCRVALCDAEPGERLILVNFEHQPAASPYRSSHAIFVLDGAREATPEPGQVPGFLDHRQLSVRAFDGDHMMTGAEVIAGGDAADCFRAMLSRVDTAYLHVHNAGRGCYMLRVARAE